MNDLRVLLLTPPFTQINTTYPATCYLKGFLNTIGVASFQSDLSLEVFLKIFSRQGLTAIFSEVEAKDLELSENAFRIYANKEAYLESIDFIISFLQHNRSTFAYRILATGFLPRASRFDQVAHVADGFGDLALIDKAKYFSTLYLEDLGDFISETVDPFFGFSRYAEKIALSLSDFGIMQHQLDQQEYLTSSILQELIREKMTRINPHLVVITVPFPGNLFAALKSAIYIKKINPQAQVALGGGYCNTELRNLMDERIFEQVDFIVLDDGERPLQILLEHIAGKRTTDMLKRTFVRHNGVVQFCDGAVEKDVPQREVGTPDYTDLKLDRYLSVLEIANPMHRLWSDGRWNKLTMAHGCYWGKCTFCDVSLDYIARYEPVSAELLCDRIEEMILKTGDRGFHFVDEAAPPALMKNLALTLIRRKIIITWWANIRFEKSFDHDLCRLLQASGCVAVSGGLEVASDRLLALIQKGVTVQQVTEVANAFCHAGIMVHAYLMYGFPTQTDQETIDALEVVRQLFLNKVIHSAFWHRFSMTAHSPVGLNPAAFQVERVGPVFAGFAENDLEHEDLQGADHDKYSQGLKKSLFNYMNGLGLNQRLNLWFDFTIPHTTIPKNKIAKIISRNKINRDINHIKCAWIGGNPVSAEKEADGWVSIRFTARSDDWSILMSQNEYTWFIKIFADLLPEEDQELLSVNEFIHSYEREVGRDFNLFKNGKIWHTLRSNGLIFL